MVARGSRQARPGEPLEDPNVTFKELFDEWMASEKRKPKTTQNYKAMYKYYLGPAFGEALLSSLQPRVMQAWVNEMVEDGYSSATIRLCRAILSACFKYALDNEMLRKFPLTRVKIPPKADREPNVLEADEARRVMDAAREVPQGIFAAFMLWAGTRPNEACGLQWKDINWEKGSVTICRDIVRLIGDKKKRIKGHWEFDTVKNESGVRTIKMPQSFFAWLKEHKTAQLELRLKAGRFWQDYDLVFTNYAGEPLSEDQYTTLWRTVLVKAELPAERVKMRPYDARHTMASLMLVNPKIPLKAVSRRLGHKRTATTSDIYQHVLKSVEEVAVEELEQIIMEGGKG
jgi:integrase